MVGVFAAPNGSAANKRVWEVGVFGVFYASRWAELVALDVGGAAAAWAAVAGMTTRRRRLKYVFRGVFMKAAGGQR